MSACSRTKEYERRTYLKQINDFTLACDWTLHRGDQSEIDPVEVVVLKIPGDPLAFFKEHLFIYSLRKTLPARVRTKKGKEILFTVSDDYWGARQVELEWMVQEEEDEKEKEDEAKNTAIVKDGVS